MQCKTLADKVPKEFIQESLEKHATTMSKQSAPLDPEMSQALSTLLDSYVREVGRVYDGYTKYPSNHSTNCYKRSDGGVLKELQDNKVMIPARLKRLTPNTRVEPIVITLAGPPGSGKSTLVKRIVRELLREYEQHPRNVYFRGAGPSHWDGYTGQFITVLDDINAFGSSNTQVSEDLKEFLQIVSECDVVLPMADLKEKGQKFTSHFIIVTTNTATLSDRALSGFSCPAAVQRRFGDVYHVLSGKIYNTEVEPMGFDHDPMRDHPLNYFRRVTKENILFN
jgi:hypothetical protein